MSEFNNSTRPKKHFKNEQRSRDAAAKKRADTVELVYSGHPSEAAKWLLCTGGLLIEVFNVYVAHGKFRWDFPY